MLPELGFFRIDCLESMNTMGEGGSFVRFCFAKNDT
jgi:hypothetical protein